MKIKHLEKVYSGKLWLMYEYFGENKYEFNEKHTISELIEDGYGDCYIKNIYVFNNSLYVVFK